MRPEDFSPGNMGFGDSHGIQGVLASMRPEDFSPGNDVRSHESRPSAWASMRPEDFSPGNAEHRGEGVRAGEQASMRPEDFSPGNPDTDQSSSMSTDGASMRPEDFSPGNTHRNPLQPPASPGFNEAGGFLPRKHRTTPVSMIPTGTGLQ